MNPMNIYGDIFAEVYNLFWTEFIDEMGPQLIQKIKNLKFKNKMVIDLCCGTGRLSKIMLNAGFTVTGVDLSSNMVEIAKRKNQDYIINGKAKFIVDNAISFHFEEKYHAVVSTFDSLNHLENLLDLEKCFKQVAKALEKDGLFIFDINTEKGLKKWDFVDVEDYETATFILHGKYDRNEKRAYAKVFGFKKSGELYEKFEEIMYNTVFRVEMVVKLLKQSGFKNIQITNEFNLDNLIKKPDEAENEDRVFVIATKK